MMHAATRSIKCDEMNQRSENYAREPRLFADVSPTHLSGITFYIERAGDRVCPYREQTMRRCVVP
jgi:hypothetical protein